MFFNPQDAKASYKELQCKGVNVLVDGEVLEFKVWSKQVEKELASIKGEPTAIFKNMLGQLRIEFE